MPKRIRLSRKKGYRKPEGCIVVTRASKYWGNPFPIGGYLRHVSWMYVKAAGLADAERAMPNRRIDAQMAVDLFRAYLDMNSGLRLLARKKLRGHDLGCTCALDAPCHADVWLEVANKEG